MDLAGPKLRTCPIEAGAQVIKWRPRRDQLGQTIAPARIWLFAEERRCLSPSPADASLPVQGEWLERLAEVQEQILWICEAAHVPVIWAT